MCTVSLQHTDFGTLFEHDDAYFLAGFLLELFETDSSAETGWTAADYANIHFVGRSLHRDCLGSSSGRVNAS